MMNTKFRDDNGNEEWRCLECSQPLNAEERADIAEYKLNKIEAVLDKAVDWSGL